MTREEIRKRLWPNETIVEFEHSISAAMNRLRQALGDSAEHPRYVETLARRGYRFIAPLQEVRVYGMAAHDVGRGLHRPLRTTHLPFRRGHPKGCLHNSLP